MREKKQRAKQDPYRWAQAQQRKNANLKRRQELEKARQEEWGDPVWTKSTPFVESLDTAGQTAVSQGGGAADAADGPSARLRNHFLTDAELEEAMKRAYTLTKSSVGVVELQVDPEAEEERRTAHEERHVKAAEALRRITSLENSSAKDRFHTNVRRIIDQFGRHNTDKVLLQKPQSIHPSTIEKPDRAGPDTGSSEVQIAILTAKIRALAQALSVNRGHKDKHNRRNLRLLLHRRQKLLKYMERKERGSERWTFMLDQLGLTPAAWKKQI